MQQCIAVVFFIATALTNVNNKKRNRGKARLKCIPSKWIK
jgi:hypothetical protein